METMFEGVKARRYGDCETVFCESVGEYTLPDYLPEVRKLLRIETKLLPTGRFEGNGRAEFTGMTAHTVIYSDEAGRLCSAVLNGDYRYAVPLTAEGDVQIFSESRPERVSYRLSGPRRLSIRTGITSWVRLLPQDPLEGEWAEAGFECLPGCQTVSDMRRVHAEGIHVDDRYRFDGVSAEQIRPIGSEATVFVKETRPQTEGIYCTGEVWVKILYVTVDGENELPDVLWRKLPFDVLVTEGEGCQTACLQGLCTSLDASVEDDGLGAAEMSIRLQLELEGTAYRQTELPYIKDVYSRSGEADVSYRRVPVAQFCGSATRNFTVSGSAPCDEMLAGARPVDCHVTAESMTAVWEEDKIKIVGDCRVEAMLLTVGGEGENPAYERTEFSFPVRLEMDGRGMTGEGVELCISPAFLGGNLRMDGGNLRVDGEMVVTVTAVAPTLIETVAKAELSDRELPAAAPNVLTVAYLEEGDTLWSMAKRYRADMQKLALRNRIPERFLQEPDSPVSIDGMNCLLIG